MNKNKEDNISAEASEKQKKKGRLDGMLEAMNKRSDPLTTHKVATEYFSSFRAERNILNPQKKEQPTPNKGLVTAVGAAVTTAVVEQRFQYTATPLYLLCLKSLQTHVVS